MNVSSQIKNLIDNISDEESVLRYVYNSNKEFIPGETPIYYSGPFGTMKK